MLPLLKSSLLTAFVLVASSPSARALTEDEALQRGKAIAAEAFATLSQELMKALAAGGPAGALKICREKAGTIAAELGKKNGAEVRRVSHKARNPGNRASEAEAKILDEYAARIAKGGALKPSIVRDAAGRLVFHAPILLAMDTCLKCHGAPGKDIAASDLALIRELYPEDAATGFKTGDVRGMWKITFNEE